MKNYLTKNLEEISQIVYESLKWISDNDSGVWSTTEWNICNHLSSLFRERFKDFDVDVELIKHDGRRPDIVIHGRGHNESNLVVFQVKKNRVTKTLLRILKDN